MGIKGIYRELGPGKRVSLAKLAADSITSNKRPYRIAIDIAIWQFQTQAARGGTNPAIRTLFYRLVRLLGTPIEPIFVFDGPNKPVFKRNKRSGRGDGVAIATAKRLIRLFGFPVHDAPGEAEAECALLQRHGVVDAVLSEDVDTIMFGCSRTLRNWSSEGRTSKTPTHVSLYDVHDMALQNLGLDREGMVLVALMSGGDYLPEGVPGCGIKVACEAAKAGFGKSVCLLKASDATGIAAWRKSLIHELHTNEQGFFRTKHKSLLIPADFPNIEILRYYTHPVVSPEASIPALREKMEQKELHLEELREFAREMFDWDYRIGAIKFIRVLGQALLVRNMKDLPEHVKVSGRRRHFSTDDTPELRLSFIPEQVVAIDLSNEVDEVAYDRNGLALNSDDESVTAPPNPAKAFDVTKPDLTWVLEGLVKNAAPATFQQWQITEEKKAAKASGRARGPLDKYVRTTKVVTPSGLPPLERSSRLKAVSNLSKHPSSSPTSPKKTTAIQEIDGSPVRSRYEQEAIYISSSPAEAASMVLASSSPSKRSSNTSLQHTQASKSIQSIIQASSSANSLKSTLQQQQQQQGRQTDKGKSKLKPNKETSGFKQSSMDTFISNSRRPRGSQALDVGSDSELEPLSSLVEEPLPQTRKLPAGPNNCSGKESSKKHSSPKKRLLRPRASASGFFEEVEMDDDEREAHLKSEGARESRSVRRSDVSVIDLTGDP